MKRNSEFFQHAKNLIPGGVNSPVRAFNGVGGEPIFIRRAEGPYLYSEDGNRYIDYVGSWGPMILGHNHPKIREAVISAAADGLSYGTPTLVETQLAEKVIELVPSIEQIRMVSSGTEATMSAIRLARGYTGRDKIIKFIGCYHGHADCLLVQAGSGALTLGEPNSPGVPESFAQQTLLADYNDLSSVHKLFEKYQDQIACVIVEPVAGNMNCIPPLPGFLAGLREACDRYDSLLIMDEVMTGFRVALGGAQAYYGITPDLTTLGKVLGGGMPVGALGGKTAIMQYLAPAGPVYQAGTLSGNPIAMHAGLACLESISDVGFHDALTQKVEYLCQGLQAAARRHQIPLLTQAVGGMFGVFFTDQYEVKDYRDVSRCDLARFKRFFHGMLQHGIYFAPSAYEAGFVSAAHDEAVLDATIAAAQQVFPTLT